MSTSQVLVTFPGSSPLEIALWHPVAIKSFYSLSILNPHSICCERNLLRMQAAVRAMSELRDLNSPDSPKLVHPPTFSVWFKCRGRLCLTLVIVIESDPGTDWLSCLNSDLPHHHGHAYSSLPQACPYCPVAASQGLWGLGAGGWGLCPAGIVILGDFLFLREQLVPIVISHHFSHLFCICLCKTKLLCPYLISSSTFLTL